MSWWKEVIFTWAHNGEVRGQKFPSLLRKWREGELLLLAISFLHVVPGLLWQDLGKGELRLILGLRKVDIS